MRRQQDGREGNVRRIYDDGKKRAANGRPYGFI
jgi:hypothetical protein